MNWSDRWSLFLWSWLEFQITFPITFIVKNGNKIGFFFSKFFNLGITYIMIEVKKECKRVLYIITFKKKFKNLEKKFFPKKFQGSVYKSG